MIDSKAASRSMIVGGGTTHLKASFLLWTVFLSAVVDTLAAVDFGGMRVSCFPRTLMTSPEDKT
jgi:hypothetical protein